MFREIDISNILIYIVFFYKTHQKCRVYSDKSPLNNHKNFFLLEKEAVRTNFRWQTTRPRLNLDKFPHWWQLNPLSSSLMTFLRVDGLKKRLWQNLSHRILNWDYLLYKRLYKRFNSYEWQLFCELLWKQSMVVWTPLNPSTVFAAPSFKSKGNCPSVFKWHWATEDSCLLKPLLPPNTHILPPITTEHDKYTWVSRS